MLNPWRPLYYLLGIGAMGWFVYSFVDPTTLDHPGYPLPEAIAWLFGRWGTRVLLLAIAVAAFHSARERQ